MRWLDGITNSMDMNLSELRELVMDREARRAAIHGVAKSWTIRKAEHRGIYAFELWCWRRLLRVPWTARRSNQSILKEISPEYSLEGVMLKVKLQYFGKIPWRRKWQPTPVLLPGKFHGWRSLVGYSPWGHKILETTEQLNKQKINLEHFFWDAVKFLANNSILLRLAFLIC